MCNNNNSCTSCDTNKAVVCIGTVVPIDSEAGRALMPYAPFIGEVCNEDGDVIANTLEEGHLDKESLPLGLYWGREHVYVGLFFEEPVALKGSEIINAFAHVGRCSGLPPELKGAEIRFYVIDPEVG